MLFKGISEEKLPANSEKYNYLNEIYKSWMSSVNQNHLDKAKVYHDLLNELISIIK